MPINQDQLNEDFANLDWFDRSTVTQLNDQLEINLYGTNEQADEKFFLITKAVFSTFPGKQKHSQDCRGLNKYQVLQEINQIRQTLKDDDRVGYLFTNKRQAHKAHIEGVIITKNEVIKPVHWHGVT